MVVVVGLRERWSCCWGEERGVVEEEKEGFIRELRVCSRCPAITQKKVGVRGKQH
jgi:hypothetical protein